MRSLERELTEEQVMYGLEISLERELTGAGYNFEITRGAGEILGERINRGAGYGLEILAERIDRSRLRF